MNIVVAISTGVLSAGFLSLIGEKEVSLFFGLFAFFSTFAVYNGQRLFKAKTLKRTPWLEWVDRNRIALATLTILSSIATLVVLALVWRMSLLNVIVLGVSGVISFMYVFRVKGKNMREIPYMKIHLISLSWVAVLIAFPMVNQNRFDHLLEYSVAHYLYVLAVTIPFDIRDLKYDLKEHRTIPQVIGVRASRILSLFLLLVFGAIMLYINDDLHEKGVFYAALFAQMALVLMMNEKRSDLYCAGLIDGAIALLGLSYFCV